MKNRHLIPYFLEKYALVFSDRKKELAFVSLVTVTLCYIFSQYDTIMNVRYYLLIFPLTTLLFLAVIDKLFSLPTKLIITSLLAIILFISCFHSIDPLSRRDYGTFYFGRHPLLSIPTIKPEGCDYGRDQLVYNLEHIQIKILLNQFYQKEHLNTTDAILTIPLAEYQIYKKLFDSLYKATLKINNSLPLGSVDNSPMSS